MIYAARAVKNKSVDDLIKGLDSLFSSTAVYDYRDIITALIVMYDAAERIGLNPNEMLIQYSNNNPDFRDEIVLFINRSMEDKALESGGYMDVHDPEFRYKSKYSG